MIFIGSYDEITPNKGYPLMKNSMNDKKYPSQDLIVSYLKRGKMVMAAAGVSKPDVFTGDAINVENGIQSDDMYAWSTDLPYYVEKYNVKLPDDFEQHIFSLAK